jgi:F0F1-type ATP synthase membrane subunit b/b'
MDARSGKIEGDRLAAEKARKEAQRLESLYLQQLTEVHQEAATRLNQARYDAYQKGRSELDSLRQKADLEVDEYREAVDRQISDERRKIQPLLQELVEIADRRVSAEGSLL